VVDLTRAVYIRVEIIQVDDAIPIQVDGMLGGSLRERFKPNQAKTCPGFDRADIYSYYHLHL
jgi:hypothetical protein